MLHRLSAAHAGRPFLRFYASKSPSTSSRLSLLARRCTYAAAGLGVLWLADTEFLASSGARNIRTLCTCLVITVDYKMNFKPEKAATIPNLHERVADRIYNLIMANGGMYIKIGQAIGNNAALLPPAMQERFSKLFDDAPQVPYSQVEKVFYREFGKPPAGPDGVFEYFEETAAASASIAQVHRAKLKHPVRISCNGAWVAVKIQKPEVNTQVEWDLMAYKLVIYLYEWAFDLPVTAFVDYTCRQFRQELDFNKEVNNARLMSAAIDSDPRISGRVYVPKVYPEYSTHRVMTAEWIDGIRLSSKREIKRLMGEDVPPAPSDAADTLPSFTSAAYGSWARSNILPLQGGTESIMKTMVELFSAQIFEWGIVHCDPHPGNIIIRPRPSSSNPSTWTREPQLVLLDHGLYEFLPPGFRRQYAHLWKSLLTGDFGAIKEIADDWGFGAPDVFATTTLLRPMRFKDPNNTTPSVGTGILDDGLNPYERGVRMKAKMKEFLQDTDKVPRELIFVMRNMRIVQGNNQTFGSPVNRIKITGLSASRALTTSPGLRFTERLHEYWRYLIFRTVMFSLDVAFQASRFRQWWRQKLGFASEGFEDELERTMRGIAKRDFGLEISHAAFQG
ncbi:ABC1-domain-containing protein [Punctularia strigosozonata HHB-11173 SS5]|uniref:ABC1-domain-containing protein n=1 Tax=Punctularia strigosozonata (strain HHB-11173) TaxID=741275 RepID=UPI00044176C6|nr:ABC1-domain-containing protein [Punctularia strigosozonata HHB-11173 SS5]EIN08686.1 ABC1-domain-containing protein [Punctularia strigosozonata HHB-11173 SS5]